MKRAKTYRTRPLFRSLFRNTSNGEDGKRSYLSVAVQRRYRDEGQWKLATNYGSAELRQDSRPRKVVGVEVA